ncbi:glycosyltransferase [Caldicellulosiruptor changbaiensis]|uniref:Glycosyltransferase n=1 Tax=Caldicellulosiruptor changbaiensis TaxID=1222016 RepID=A0A3T0D635_9FIRM|nr:glycoside hydrolase family 88 protein [Caldicellulosiruptor changbaiensis]AZT90535.1 glycosyltransferase [Caldicellulosiruptor changbaiensis]
MKKGMKRLVLPSLNTKHLFRMTDSTGILQHAKFSVPNYKEGYTTDDNARALIVALRLFEKTGDKAYLDLVYRYMAFLYNSYTDDGYFRNFMNYSRVFIDEKGTEDCFARSLIALSYVYSSDVLDSSIKELSYVMLKRSLRNVLELKYPISMAYAIIALSMLHDIKEFSNEAKMYLEALSEKLLNLYKKHSDENWKWFSNKLTYANAILPYALFRAFAVTEKERYLKVAKESLDFLTTILFENGILRVIGNRGWYEKGKERSYFDEQPIDACDCVLAYTEAYKITEDKEYKEKALKAFRWFLGENVHKQPLYDEKTGGCRDGIEEDGINQNQGAESTICYLLARLYIEDLIKSEEKSKEVV